jgi:TonB-linked SusC/RagA family outer membrane protein
MTKFFNTMVIGIALMSLPAALMAQDLNISGRVVDDKGEPVVGASVIVKGTTNGAMTDINGNYDIKASGDATLTFSFLGMGTAEEAVAGRGRIDVVLSAGSQDIDEVVVVGYGTQKRASVVGSVQSIRATELKAPTTSLSNAFAGRLAGVIAVQRSGAVGADGADFWIRGVSTLTQQKPLVVIDGVQASTADLNNIAPEMIDNFSVLKDATATALYGVLGANGVLIVNTKSGVTDGKPIINVRVEQTFKTPQKVPEVVDAVTFMEAYNAASIYRGNGQYYSDDKIEGTRRGGDPLVYPNVDWYNEMFRNLSSVQLANLNVRGGGGKADYYLGVNFTNEDGMLKSVSKNYYTFDNALSLQKYVFQSNVNVRLHETSKIALRINTQLRNYAGPSRDGDDVNYIFSNMMRDGNPADFPIFYPTNDERRTAPATPDHVMWGKSAGESRNPMADMTEGYRSNFQSTVIATLSADQKLDILTKGLSVNLMASFKNWGSTTNNKYMSNSNMYSVTSYNLNADGSLRDYVLTPNSPPNTSVLTPSASTAGDRTVYLQGQINYDRTFGELHSVQAMVLYNQREYDNNVPGASLIVSLPERKQGIAGRVSYAYDSRYLAELNFGYNGSESFAPGHRFGFFPSAAVGYNISQEKFWQPLEKYMSHLKLRASWGLVGNDYSGTRFMYLSDISLTDGGREFHTGRDGSTYYNGVRYVRYANEDLTWEVGEKINLGLDANVYGFNIMFDVFRENRTNIFRERGTLPAFMGVFGLNRYGTNQTIQNVAVYGNLSEVKNQGIDLSINYDKKLTPDLMLSLRGTFTYAHNEVLDLDEPSYQEYPNTSQVGHQLNQNLMLVSNGLFIDQAEIANSAIYSGSASYIRPGDIMYVDMPNSSGIVDGQIDANDRIYYGYPTTPEIMYGFGANVTWKGFDFGVFFQGAAHVSLMMSGFHPFRTENALYNRNLLKWIAEDYYDPANPNPNAGYPALTSATTNPSNTQSSTFWYRDASFLKLRNVEAGYTWKFMRAYVTLQNLLTISKFDLWDPEEGGGSGFKYPNQRVYSVGLQFNF